MACDCQAVPSALRACGILVEVVYLFAAVRTYVKVTADEYSQIIGMLLQDILDLSVAEVRPVFRDDKLVDLSFAF